jgi:uncharacterized protein YkwD
MHHDASTALTTKAILPLGVLLATDKPYLRGNFFDARSLVVPTSAERSRLHTNRRVPARSRRRLACRRLVYEALEDRQLLSAVPSNYEQYILELVNRGRADPAAEAARYGVGLNEGLAAGTISTAAKQPLAFSPNLIQSGQLHSQWMLDTDTFSHTGSGGTDPGDRMANAGYSFTGGWGWGENIAWQGTTGAINVYSTLGQIEKNLFVDSGIEGRGHRLDLMNPSFREVGVGVRTGSFTGYNAVMVTQDFAYSGNSVFLTGVVYNDELVQVNDFYTPGEGLGSVTISATRLSDQAVFTTTTWASGGYSLALPQGTYDVTASGTALGRVLHRNQVTIGAQNVKVDFTLSEKLPVLSIANVAQAEGNDGTKTFTFAVTLSGTHDYPVTVSYATANGTATAGSDYVATSGSRTWDAGIASTQFINVTVYGDTNTEPDETFFVNLGSVADVSVVRSQGVGTILSDDFVSSVAVGEAAAPKNGALEANDKLVITWAAVSAGSIVSQTVTIDGATKTSIGGPYSGRYYSCAVGTWSAGSHNYTIRSTDSRGLVSTASGSFTVVAPILPAVASVVVAEAAAPKNGRLEASDKLKITWAASSSNRIASQSVTVDGRAMASIAGPFSGLYYSCTIGTYAAGIHTYKIRSTDAKGASSMLTGTFTVLAPPPPAISSVVIAEAGTVKNGTLDPNEKLKITWVASSARGIASQTVTVDGRKITPIGGPYSSIYYSCAIGAFSAGQHTYTIKSTDSKGLSSTKSGTFTVTTPTTAADQRGNALMALMQEMGPLFGRGSTSTDDPSDAILPVA